MDGDVLALVNAVPATGTFVLVLIVMLRRPPAVAMLDTSVHDWIDRLERALDQSERRELVREVNDSAHRAWDSSILLAIALGKDADDIRARVEILGPPPRLSPEPSEWLAARATEHARRSARRAAAPIAPEIPANK